MTWMLRFLAGITLALVVAGGSFADGRRMALILGNGAYQDLPTLDNAVADANNMARVLREQGFDVTLLTDPGAEVFQAVLDTFSRQAQGADSVLFYYAGHAFQMNGINHLVPVSARIETAADAEAQTWKLDDIAARLRGGQQGGGPQLLIFLDACRDNPLSAGVTGAAPGLAQFDGGAGTFVAFATRPGSAAFDGGPGGSPFTAALVKRIGVPGLSISDLMIEVRNEVQQTTGGAQVPWDQSSLRSQFYFDAAKAADPAPAAAVSPAFEVVASATTIGGPATAVTGQIAAAPEPAVPTAPVVVQLAALDAPSLSPLTGETRGLPVLSGVTRGEEELPRLSGVDPALRVVPVPEAQPEAEQAPEPPVAAPAVTGPEAEQVAKSPDPAASVPVTAASAAAPAPAALFSSPEDLARAAQEELKRIGCYTSTVDGDWGNGSRRALSRYFEAKKIDADAVDPTEALYLQLKGEPTETCKPVRAAIPAPKKQQTSTTRQGTTQQQPQRAATTEKKAAPAPAPAEKKGVECKFMVVAIVCK